MESKPNVIVIMTDQQQANLRKREGFVLDTTPYVDSLGEQGVDFKRAYTSMPVCAPARTSLFTGRFPTANHVKTNHNLEDAFFTKDLIQVLKEAGYNTALCGKNHSHLAEGDFDFNYTFNHDGADGEEKTRLEEEFDAYIAGLKHLTAKEATPFPVECQGPYRIVDKAQEWIGQNDDNPFFMWLSFAEPHNPYQVPEPYYSMFPPESLPPTNTHSSSLAKKNFKYKWLRKKWEAAIPDFEDQLTQTRSNYFGMLRLIDDQVKRFVHFLEEKKLSENTLIIYLTDHGDFCGEYGLIRKGPGLSELLCRIPMIFSGPGIKSQKTQNDDVYVSIVDIMPTICEAIGVDIPAGVQGRSLWPILTGEEYPIKEFDSIYAEHGFGNVYYKEDDDLDPAEEEAMEDSCTFDELNSYTQSGTEKMVIKNQWKLIFNVEGTGELYDLQKDPFELDNLFEEEDAKEKKHELIEELLRWVIRIEDPLPYPRERYDVKVHQRNYYFAE